MRRHDPVWTEARSLDEADRPQRSVLPLRPEGFDRLPPIAREHAVLVRELAHAQRKNTRQAAEFARFAEQTEAELMRLRAEVIRRDTEIALLREHLAELEAAALGASLAAADLVICQTGCLSHDAYWRVRDHCRRTGKRCIFVEGSSRSALERLLGEVCDTQPVRYLTS